jgi:hypothetical protein
MKKIIVLSTVLALASWTYGQNPPAQQPAQASSPDKIQLFDGQLTIPKEYSKEDVKNSLLDDYELADEWSCDMPREQGVALKLRIKKPQASGADDTYCLGVKSMVYSRGFNWLEIKPPVPVKIPPKSKAIAVTTFGRNLRHTLVAWVEDYLGVEYRIVLGSMNFKGWQKVAAVIPSYVRTYSRYVPEDRPLWLKKLVVEFDPDEFPMTAYYYFDNFEAAVDTYKEPYAGDDMINEDGEDIFELQQRTWLTNSRRK